MTLTIASNLRRAFIDRETVKIGGGEFTPEECKEAALQLASFDDLLAALEEVTKLNSDWTDGKAYVPVAWAKKNAEAIKNARAAIAKARNTD